MKKLVMTLFILAMPFMLIACGSENDTPSDESYTSGNHMTEENSEVEESDMVEESNETEESDIDEEYVVGMETEPQVPEDNLVWIVPPMLEHDRIYYCSVCDIFSTELHGGREIDRTTGLFLDDDPTWGGHGGGGGTPVYDPELNLFGIAGTDAYSGMVMLPLDEFMEQFPFVSGNLMAIQIVDSTRVTGTEWDEWLEEDAFTGRFLVMYDGILVSDFEFDSGGLSLDDSDIINMRIGDKWGFVDRNGDTVIPFVFERILWIDGDSVFAHYNGRYGILNIRRTLEVR